MAPPDALTCFDIDYDAGNPNHVIFPDPFAATFTPDDDLLVDLRMYPAGVVLFEDPTNWQGYYDNHPAIDRVRILGSDYDDILCGSQYFGNVIRGRSGDDIILGADSADGPTWPTGLDPRLIMWGADDTLFGGMGDDLLIGFDGQDTLYGNAGDDLLDGGGDDDMLYGQTGADILLGDLSLGTGVDGEDTLRGGPGDDTLIGFGENDDIAGQKGNDYAEGGDDNDDISGGFGNDELYGDAGNDYIEGNAHNDTIYGGADDDDLYGDTEAFDTVFDGCLLYTSDAAD